MEKKRYLGDSVYAEIEWPGIKLTTNNGLGDSNVIYLESAVWWGLVEFVRQYEEEQRKQKQQENKDG